jgi:hypothetical protein
LECGLPMPFQLFDAQYLQLTFFDALQNFQKKKNTNIRIQDSTIMIFVAEY